MGALRENKTLRMAISAMPSTVGKIKYALDSDAYTDEDLRAQKILFELINLQDCLDVIKDQLTTKHILYVPEKEA